MILAVDWVFFVFSSTLEVPMFPISSLTAVFFATERKDKPLLNLMAI